MQVGPNQPDSSQFLPLPARETEVRTEKMDEISSRGSHLIDLLTAILIPNQAPAEPNANLDQISVVDSIIDEHLTYMANSRKDSLHSARRSRQQSVGTDQGIVLQEPGDIPAAED